MIFSTLFVDVFQTLTKKIADSYSIIFVIEGILFLAAALLATKLIGREVEMSKVSHEEKI